MFLNLKWYTLDTYYKELSDNIKGNRLIARSIIDALKKKGDYDKLKAMLQWKDQTDIVTDWDNDVESIFYNKTYVWNQGNEKGVAESISGINNGSSNNGTVESGAKIWKYNLNKIDNIREYSNSLTRILIELRRTIHERFLTSPYCPKDKYKDITEEISSQYNKNDIYSRWLFAKCGNKEWPEIQSNNNSLWASYETVKSKHLDWLDKLKEFIESRNSQIYICFKCSNIWTYSLEKENSTCGFDKNCTSLSNFHCKRCDISFCSYCISFPKSLLCLWGHSLTPKYIPNDLNTDNPICCKCDKEIQSERYLYHCSQCNNTNWCPSCHDKHADLNLRNDYNCSCGKIIYWKRGVYRVCAACKQKKKCHWFCWFCQVNYCAHCLPTTPKFCGGEHQMEDINLNWLLIKNKGKDRHQGKSKHTNKKVMDIINGFNFLNNASCDICENNKCTFKYSICYRCNYIKCHECSRGKTISNADKK